MDLGLAGRHVLITGGSKGIGYACAEQFAHEGARVTLVARQQQRIDEAVDQLRALGCDAVGYSADLSNWEVAAALIEHVSAAQGAIDVLVNSAGAAQRVPFDRLQPVDWHAAMGAKFFSYIHVLNPVIKRMGEAGRGSIVNIVGVGGKMASPTHLAGGAANAALMLASAGLAAAYGPSGVRLNVVNPGVTMTERLERGFAADAQAQRKEPNEIIREAKEKLPLRRFATPAEIANAVVFLASDRASYVTGAVLAMDGALVPMVV